MVAHSFTRLVAWAMPAIMVSDSIWTPQWLVTPPKPRHFPIDMTKSMPTSSAVTDAARFCFHRPSRGGVVEEMIQPPLATGRKTPYSCLFAPMSGLLLNRVRRQSSRKVRRFRSGAALRRVLARRPHENDGDEDHADDGGEQLERPDEAAGQVSHAAADRGSQRRHGADQAGGGEDLQIRS